MFVLIYYNPLKTFQLALFLLIGIDVDTQY